MNVPEILSLTPVQVATLLLLLGAIDTIFAIVVAAASGNFSGVYVTDFLLTHVAKIWLPIFGLELLGAGIAGLPPIPAFGDAALAGLLAYAVAVVASLKVTMIDRAVPKVPTP